MNLLLKLKASGMAYVLGLCKVWGGDSADFIILSNFYWIHLPSNSQVSSSEFTDVSLQSGASPELSAIPH